MFLLGMALPGGAALLNGPRRYACCRVVEAQVQPVVEAVQPGPLASRLRWSAAEAAEARCDVARALDSWEAKHGRREALLSKAPQ